MGLRADLFDPGLHGFSGQGAVGRRADEEQVDAFQLERVHVGNMLQLHVAGQLGRDGGSYCLHVAIQ